MSYDGKPEIAMLDHDGKSSAIHNEDFDKKELGSSHVGDEDVVYPEALRNMPGAPSVETLQHGLKMQHLAQSTTLGQQVNKEWRLILASMPYLIGVVGNGFDNGAQNITSAMPAFLIKFGGFNPVTHSLFLDSTWVSLWTSMFFLGTLIGTLASGPAIERFGPRKISFVFNALMLGAVAVQVTTNTKEQLLAGKILAGIALGFLNVTASNFISESSPSKLRGPLSAGVGMAGIIGIVLGITTGSQVIGKVEPTGWASWRLTLAMQWLCPVISLLTLPFSTTSPVYLIKRGLPDQAAAVLAKLHGIKDESATRARLATLQYAVASEMEEASKLEPISYKELFTDKTERRRTWTTIGLWFAFQAGGNCFLGQGLYFLQAQGLDIVIATDITLACLSLSAIIFLLAGYIMERTGRRSLFVYMNAVHGILMLGLGICGFFKTPAAGWMVAVLINLGVSTQSLATGGPAYSLTAELSSVRARAKTISLGIFTNAALNFATTFIIPYVYQAPGNLGAKTAMIFFGTTVFAVIWAYLYVPETKGRTALEIDALYHSGVAPRHWAKTDAQALINEHQHELAANAHRN